MSSSVRSKIRKLRLQCKGAFISGISSRIKLSAQPASNLRLGSIGTKIRRRRSTADLGIIQRILGSQSSKNRFILYIILGTRIGLIPIGLNLPCRRILSGFLGSVSRRLSRSLCSSSGVGRSLRRGLGGLCRSLSTLCRSSRTLSGTRMTLSYSCLRSSRLGIRLCGLYIGINVLKLLVDNSYLSSTLVFHSLNLSTSLSCYETNLLGTFVRYR